MNKLTYYRAVLNRNALDESIDDLQELLNDNIGDISSLTTLVNSHTSTLSTHTTSISTNTSNIATNTTNISTNTSSINTISNNIVLIQSDITDLENKDDSLDTDIATINGTLTTINTNITSVNDYLDDIQDQITALNILDFTGITQSELNQLGNINTNTISATNWTMLTNIDQALGQSSAVRHASIQFDGSQSVFNYYKTGSASYTFDTNNLMWQTASNPVKTITYTRIGNTVKLKIQGFSTAMDQSYIAMDYYIATTTAIPSEYRPTNDQKFIIPVIEGSSGIYGILVVRSDGYIHINKNLNTSNLTYTFNLYAGIYETSVSYIM